MAAPITLARPYAKAAFEQAHSEGKLADWSAMLALAAAVANDEKGRSFITDPRLEESQHAQLVLEVGGEAFDAHFGNFIRLLAENRRLAVLPEIAALYTDLRADAEKTLEVEVISAAEMGEEQRSSLEKKLSDKFGREVHTHYKVDEQMLGGAIIRAGDTVIDGSLRGRLSRLGERLGD